MSHREKSKLLQIGVLLLSFFSCSNGDNERSEFFAAANSNLNKDSFSNRIAEGARDTIESWIDLDLEYFYFYRDSSIYQWTLDDWIFFNSKSDKCILSLLRRDFNNPNIDNVTFILGEKYQNKWWFYAGPTMAIMQENYSKSKSELALPFSQLSELARKNSLNWYYVEKENGACLKELFRSGYENYKKCKEEKYLINSTLSNIGF